MTSLVVRLVAALVGSLVASLVGSLISPCVLGWIFLAVRLVGPTALFVLSAINHGIESACVFEIEIFWNVGSAPLDLAGNQPSGLHESHFTEVIGALPEVIINESMVVDSEPDVLYHLLFLSFLHFFIKVFGVLSRHQDYAVVRQMICGKVWGQPNFCISLVVEADVIISDGKGPKTIKQLMESSKCFTERIQSLAMVEIASIREPIRDVFCEDLDGWLCLAHGVGLGILSIIDPNNGFISIVAVIVDFHLIFGVNLGIIGDNMFFGVSATAVMVYIVVVTAVIVDPFPGFESSLV